MRPKQVALACRILWLVLVLSVVTLHPDIRGEWWVLPTSEPTIEPLDPESEAALQEFARVWPAFIVGMVILFAVLYAFLVWTIGKGHGWARWMLLAFVLGTTAMALPDFGRSLAETPLAFAADLCFTAAELWAFWLLFFSPGAAWFKVG